VGGRRIRYFDINDREDDERSSLGDNLYTVVEKLQITSFELEISRR
jgi:hypothetical protein